MAIKGQLHEMSLPALAQVACQGGGPARLSLRRGDQEAVLYFDQGTIIHATSGAQVGEEVVYHVLTWETGEFSLESGGVAPPRTIHTPWSVLLMDGLHRRDEARWDTLDIEQIKEEYDMPENMKDILRELGGQVTGFIATAVVGMDGLGVANHGGPGFDEAAIEAINAQMTMLFKLVNTTVEKLGAGTIEDYLLTTERAYLLIRYLHDKNYYLGIAADRKTGNLGNMRLNSRLFAERLSKALPR